MKLDGKVAVVTGAAQGIGEGCALALAAAGADVVVNDREASPEAAAVAEKITELGRQCRVMPGNVFERDVCQAIVDQTVHEFRRIDILVCNPAYSQRGAFLDYDPQTLRKTLEGTLESGFHMSQLVARHMVERGGDGKILFICTVHSLIPCVGSFAYNAAKAGLKQMAMTMAAELAGHRINVNVIDPGWIDTPCERGRMGAEALAEAGRALPWGRMGTPADIGNAAAFLCSDAADYITGAALLVDGGFCLRAAMSHS